MYPIRREDILIDYKKQMIYTIRVWMPLGDLLIDHFYMKYIYIVMFFFFNKKFLKKFLLSVLLRHQLNFSYTNKNRAFYLLKKTIIIRKKQNVVFVTRIF